MTVLTRCKRYGLLQTIGLALLACYMITSCSLYGERQQFGNDVQADLMIFFKTEITDQQIEEFWRVVLGKPDPRQGFQLQDGIAGIYRSHTIQGHASLVLYFSDSASSEQRANLKSRIKQSPLIFKILDNTIPNTVDRIE